MQGAGPDKRLGDDAEHLFALRASQACARKRCTWRGIGVSWKRSIATTAIARPSVISITYVSPAVAQFSETTLLHLVDQSQKINERLGITGILAYSDGNLRQAIEDADLPTCRPSRCPSASGATCGIVTSPPSTTSRSKCASSRAGRWPTTSCRRGGCEPIASRMRSSIGRGCGRCRCLKGALRVWSARSCTAERGDHLESKSAVPTFLDEGSLTLIGVRSSRRRESYAVPIGRDRHDT